MVDVGDEPALGDEGGDARELGVDARPVARDQRELVDPAQELQARERLPHGHDVIDSLDGEEAGDSRFHPRDELVDLPIAVHDDVLHPVLLHEIHRAVEGAANSSNMARDIMGPLR